jgi:hypothetical protein
MGRLRQDPIMKRSFRISSYPKDIARNRIEQPSEAPRRTQPIPAPIPQAHLNQPT